MPDKKFLEESPLYKAFELGYAEIPENFPKPALNLHCDICESNQTFNMINDYWERAQGNDIELSGIFELLYKCASCGARGKSYFVMFGGTAGAVTVMKVGQYPAWEITPHPKIAKMLGEHVEEYKKGLACESQSYGIASFAYYRRIVEEIIDRLLDDIAELVEDEAQEQYLVAVEEAKKTRVTEKKIELVKDRLPSSLRPGNINPLSVLHSALSEGLHAESDEHCLELAEAIRKSLVFLVDQISSEKIAAESFAASIRKLQK